MNGTPRSLYDGDDGKFRTITANTDAAKIIDLLKDEKDIEVRIRRMM
jgi:hypothetical protein